MRPINWAIAQTFTWMTWFIPTPNYVEIAVDMYWNDRMNLVPNIPGI